MIVCGRDLQFLSVIPNTPNWFIAIRALHSQYFIFVGVAARTHYECTSVKAALTVWAETCHKSQISLCQKTYVKFNSNLRFF